MKAPHKTSKMEWKRKNILGVATKVGNVEPQHRGWWHRKLQKGRKIFNQSFEFFYRLQIFDNIASVSKYHATYFDHQQQHLIPLRLT